MPRQGVGRLGPSASGASVISHSPASRQRFASSPRRFAPSPLFERRSICASRVRSECVADELATESETTTRRQTVPRVGLQDTVSSDIGEKKGAAREWKEEARETRQRGGARERCAARDRAGKEAESCGHDEEAKAAWKGRHRIGGDARDASRKGDGGGAAQKGREETKEKGGGRSAGREKALPPSPPPPAGERMGDTND